MQKRLSRTDWLGISNIHEITRGHTHTSKLRAKAAAAALFPNLQITTLTTYLGMWVINGGESGLG